MTSMTVILDFFFFFQAEDGIRDVAVTGVQTCALPISLIAELMLQQVEQLVTGRRHATDAERHRPHGESLGEPHPEGVRLFGAQRRESEIGRASCRERV